MNEVRYVDSGGHHLAFRVRGEAAGHDIVLFTPAGTVPMDFLERDRVGARLVEGLATMGRLVLFDRRGIGWSDPIRDWSRPLVEQWAEDVAAIVDQVCTRPAVIIGLGDYWGPARLFAAEHPVDLVAVVLYEPMGPTDAVDFTTGFGDGWIRRVCPSRADDKGFVEWFDAAGRTGASPIKVAAGHR